jgi:outer membrane protein TolC
VADAVGNYFLIALVNQNARKAAEANVDRWGVFSKSVHVLVENQLRPGVDGSRADAELARAKIQLYRAQQAERAALDTLAALMGTAGSEIQLDSGTLLDLPPSSTLSETAVSTHPLAVDLMTSVRQVQAQEKVLQRTNYPRFLLQAEAIGRGSGVPTNGVTFGHWNGLAPGLGNWLAGMTILFPDVFGFKAVSIQKQMASANEREQQARYDQAIQDLTGHVQIAQHQLKSAQLVAQETPTELSAARQSETQSRARYDAGLATLVEVSEAENLLAQAETDDAIARISVWRGLLDVAYAQGDLSSVVRLLHGPAGGK